MIRALVKVCKKVIKNSLPRNLRIESPVVQLYIGFEGITSRYSLTNIPSFYSPKTAYPISYECSMFNGKGDRVARKSVTLNPFCSFEVIPADFFGKKMPDMGIFVAKMRAKNWLQFSDKHLGDITAHFYSFYHQKKSGAMALIHPQTHMNGLRGEKEWKSRVFIDSMKTIKILILQINPTKLGFKNKVTIYSLDNTEVTNISFNIPPMGCEKQTIELTALNIKSRYFYIGSNKLSTENAKPIIFLYDKNENFFGLHA